MDQILSQEEIDALLSGLGEGEIETPGAEEAKGVEERPKAEVKSFDFLKYTRAKIEKLPALQFVYERFAKSFRAALALFIEKGVEIEHNPIHYIEYNEFKKTLPLPTNMNVVTTENLKGFFIIIFDAKMIFAVLETIFGGSNISTPRIEGREFTKIELNVIKRLIDLVCNEMEKAWAPVYEIRCRYSRSEVNPNYITMVSQEEIVSVCELSLEIEEITTWMKICIPYNILETIKPYLTSTPSREDMEMKEKWCNRLRERVEELPIEIRAIAGKRHMTLREFLEITKESVIVLDRYVDDLVDLVINDKTMFKGKMGIYKGNKAVRVEEKEEGWKSL
jgi:flagellar motor switch protein FliM